MGSIPPPNKVLVGFYKPYTPPSYKENKQSSSSAETSNRVTSEIPELTPQQILAIQQLDSQQQSMSQSRKLTIQEEIRHFQQNIFKKTKFRVPCCSRMLCGVVRYGCIPADICFFPVFYPCVITKIACQMRNYGTNKCLTVFIAGAGLLSLAFFTAITFMPSIILFSENDLQCCRVL